MVQMTEEELEIMSLNWFKEIGYSCVHDPQLTPEGKSSEREDFRKVILINRLRNKENRAVIFNSNLFHETDHYEFEEGYENCKINVTMLFGNRRNAQPVLL